MPQLLKSFKPQLVNTSDTSAVLFIQTFLTNPQTGIQDTIDQVKPDNLIVETAAGYKLTSNSKNLDLRPNTKDFYQFNMIDYINNFSRYKREHSPLEFMAWLDKNNIPMLSSSHHPISQDKTQKDHAVLIQEDSLLFSKQEVRKGADAILKYLNQSSPSAGVLSLPDGNNISITRHAERFFIFDPRGSLTQYSQQELRDFLMQQQHLTFAPLRPGPRLTLEPFHDRLFATSSSSSFFKPPAPSAPPQQPVSALLISVSSLIDTDNQYSDYLISKILANVESTKNKGRLTKVILLPELQHQLSLISNLKKYLEQKGVSVYTVSPPNKNKRSQIINTIDELNKNISQDTQYLASMMYINNEESGTKENLESAMQAVKVPSLLAYYGGVLTSTKPPLLKQVVAHTIYKTDSQPTPTMALSSSYSG